MRWLLHFAVFGFYFKAVIIDSMKSLGHSPVSYMLLINCVITLRPSSPNISEHIRIATKLTRYGTFRVTG
jgi:Polyphosphate kinase